MNTKEARQDEKFLQLEKEMIEVQAKMVKLWEEINTNFKTKETTTGTGGFLMTNVFVNL